MVLRTPSGTAGGPSYERFCVFIFCVILRLILRLILCLIFLPRSIKIGQFKSTTQTFEPRHLCHWAQTCSLWARHGSHPNIFEPKEFLFFFNICSPLILRFHTFDISKKVSNFIHSRNIWNKNHVNLKAVIKVQTGCYTSNFFFPSENIWAKKKFIYKI